MKNRKEQISEVLKSFFGITDDNPTIDVILEEEDCYLIGTAIVEALKLDDN